jgi:DNA primase
MEQINALEKISDEVLIAYDGDNAGIEATSRAIDLLSNQSSMGIQIISIPDTMDPDDYRRKYGEDNLHQLIKNSRETVFQFKKDYLKRNKNLTIEADKLLYIDELLGELIHVSSIVEVDLALSQLADEFHVSKNTLQNELRTKKQSFKQQSMASFSQVDYGEKEIVIPKHYEVKKIGQVEKAEMTLIFRLLTERSAYQFLSAREDLTFAHDVYQELYLHLTNYIQLHGEIVIADFLDYLKEQELKQVLIQTTMQNFSEESTKQELEDCLLVIKKGEIQERINTLINDQQEARRVGNSDLEAEATLQIIMLQKQLKSI